MTGKVIAVDFDGTLCENKFPEIGEPKKDIIDAVKKLRQQGNKIILWSCRSGQQENVRKGFQWLQIVGASQKVRL